MSTLTGKVAVVTGASKGIGAAIAKALAAEGAAVIVNYASSREGADRVVADIAKTGGKARAVQGDVSKSADIQRLFSETKKAFGTLDILVNNAGVYKFEPLEAVTEAEFHRMYNTNVLGLILATQEALKYFGPHGGSVINIGSVASRSAPPQSVVYSSTKGAVDVVTKVLSQELGPRKIRVNALNPGGVETEGVHSAGIMGSDFEKLMIAGTPLGPHWASPMTLPPPRCFWRRMPPAGSRRTAARLGRLPLNCAQSIKFPSSMVRSAVRAARIALRPVLFFPPSAHQARLAPNAANTLFLCSTSTSAKPTFRSISI